MDADAISANLASVAVDVNPRAEEARRYLEVPVIIAALLVIPVIVIEGSVIDPFWINVAIATNWFIWFVFLIDLVVMLWLVDDRKAYMRTGWLDLFIVVTSFPPITTFGDATRADAWQLTTDS